jgi:hypothetical protein
MYITAHVTAHGCLWGKGYARWIVADRAPGRVPEVGRLCMLLSDGFEIMDALLCQI